MRATLVSSQQYGHRLRILLPAVLASLSACSWLGSRTPQPPGSTQIIVTDAPVGSILFVDGGQRDEAPTIDVHPQVLQVAPGDHKVEIHLGDPIIYREDTTVALGESRVVTVLSGFNR